MKDAALLATAALLSAAAAAGTTLLVATADARVASEAGPAVRDGADLSARLAALEAQQEELERFLAALSEPVASAGPAEPDEGAVEAAVQAWLEANREALVQAGPGGDAGGGATLATLDPAVDALREAPLGELIELVTDGSLGGQELQDAWERLAAAGRLADVVGELERLVSLDPQDPELRVTLGNAYLQQLFQGGAGPMAGVFASKADAAFDAALKIDEGHWEARFMKAVSLSNWPAFLGKQGEAIAEFEHLIELQEERSLAPEHAQSYLFLGNMYLETGNIEEALAAWSRGLERFPASDELRAQLQRNGGGR